MREKSFSSFAFLLCDIDDLISILLFFYFVRRCMIDIRTSNAQIPRGPRATNGRYIASLCVTRDFLDPTIRTSFRNLDTKTIGELNLHRFERINRARYIRLGEPPFFVTSISLPSRGHVPIDSIVVELSTKN